MEKKTPAFEQLVSERTAAPSQHFLSNGQTTTSGNPFGQNYSKPASTTAATSTDSVNAQKAEPGQQQARRIPERFAKERAETDALKTKVDGIQLSLVMQMLGASGNQDNDKSKWKIPGIGNITVTGQMWYNLEAETGGRGAVGLIRHAKNLKYHLAVRWLAAQFGESIDSDDIKASLDSMAVREKKTFNPPLKIEKNISFVRHYLRFTRKLPEQLIDTMIAQGRIYADEHRNCVFASEGIAELRSSFDGPDAVKKLVPGSTRKKGFLVLPDPQLNQKTLAICESSIDAMSYRAMNPGHAAISSAGANRAFPRAIAEEAIESGFKVVAAFDADTAGDKASQALFNHFYIKLWIKHKCQTELRKTIDDEELFNLLDSNTVTCNLATKPIGNDSDDAEPDDENENFDSNEPDGEQETKNLLFFNDPNAFAPDNPKGPPTILVTIKKNGLDLPQCSSFPIVVTQKGYEFIVDKIGLIRTRPTGEKDWNEMIKKSGTPATQNAQQLKNSI